MPVFNKITELFVKVKDALGNNITSTDLGGGKRGLDVNVEITPSEAVKIRDKDSAGQEVIVDTGGNLYVKVTSIPNVDINSLPSVDINSMPSVDINSLPNVTVVAIPDVILRDGTTASQKAIVDASGNVYAKVDGLNFNGNNLQVSIENQPTVDVNSVPDVILRDKDTAGNKLIIDSSGNAYVKVNGLTFNGDNLQVDVQSIVDLIVRDPDTPGNKLAVDSNGHIFANIGDTEAGHVAKVDESGNLYVVSPAPEAPAGKDAINDTQQSTISGTDDSYTTIPSGEIITIQRLKGGSEYDATAGSKVELYYAPNGNDTGLVLIEAEYMNGNSVIFDLNYNSVVGNGTRAILLRRKRLGGGSKEIFGKWEGYY